METTLQKITEPKYYRVVVTFDHGNSVTSSHSFVERAESVDEVRMRVKGRLAHFKPVAITIQQIKPTLTSKIRSIEARK